MVPFHCLIVNGVTQVLDQLGFVGLATLPGVLVVQEVAGRVFVKDPSTTTIQTPALYFANVFKDDPDARVPAPLWSYKAYAPTLEQALILAINLRDPQLLTSRNFKP